MLKVNNKEARTTSTVSLFLSLSLTLLILVIVNFEPFSHLVRREKCRNTCFIPEKRRKTKFNRLQIELFFLLNIRIKNISPPYISPPEQRLTKFVLCPYIHPGRINGILRYLQIFQDKKRIGR